MTHNPGNEDDTDVVKTRLRDIELELLRQEHRPLILLRNWWSHRHLPPEDDFRTASVVALLWNFFFSPATAVTSAGILTIALLAWQNVLLSQSNEIMRSEANLDGHVAATVVRTVVAPKGDDRCFGAAILIENASSNPFYLSGCWVCLEGNVRFTVPPYHGLIKSNDAILVEYPYFNEPDEPPVITWSQSQVAQDINEDDISHLPIERFEFLGYTDLTTVIADVNTLPNAESTQVRFR